VAAAGDHNCEGLIERQVPVGGKGETAAADFQGVSEFLKHLALPVHAADLDGYRSRDAPLTSVVAELLSHLWE